MPTLHVYLDESGNFDFSPRGSRTYAFAVAWTYDPAPMAQDLTSLRFRLLKEGQDLQSFHATEDRQANRDAVVEVLRRHGTWQFAALIVDKAKVYPPIREEQRFYPQFASYLLRFVFRGRVQSGTDKILIFTDSLPVKKKREAVEKAIKTTCRAELEPTLPFHCFHHSRASNCWIQVADYCSWAVFRKWEKGDTRTYDQLRCRLAAPELDVLAAGTVRHY